MIPASHEINIRRGDTFRLYFRIKNKSGTYPNLTGWGTGLAQVRDEVDGTVIFTMTVTKGNQTTYPGSVLCMIASAVTKAADFDLHNKGVWDFEITNDLGETDTYIEGPVVLEKDVSKTP